MEPPIRTVESATFAEPELVATAGVAAISVNATHPIEGELRQLDRERSSRRTGREPHPSVFLSSDRFIERELIGEGGMGFVVRAFDTQLQRDVAIKILGRESPTSEVDFERLAEEARITGQLEHPYIVPVYEFGEDDRGTHFLCMKLVKGESLEDMLQRAGESRLTPDRLTDLLQILVKICDAVAYAHSRGVLHRDLKPSNVMVGDFGLVQVVDWGVARSVGRAEDARPLISSSAPSDPSGMVGTPPYMAPEQLRGLHHEQDERTDVFGLGGILYQMLTSEPPHTAKTFSDIAWGNARVSIAPPKDLVHGSIIPAELSRIAVKALSHDPADRYQSVIDFKREVELFQRGAWDVPQAHFRRDSVIVSEGDKGDCAYVIVQGRCVAFSKDGSDEVALREMGPGDVFGETAVVSKKPRSASVKALTDVVVMVVAADVLSNGLGLNSWMGSFVRALADRFREVDEQLRRLQRSERKRRSSSR